jgi:hypothetical protein
LPLSADDNFLARLADTGWLMHVRTILEAAVRMLDILQVASGLVLFYLALSSLIWSGLVWSGLVLPYLVLSSLVLSGLVLPYLVLSYRAHASHHIG